ncbi:MAG: pilus assembly protein PilM [Candidatus Zipacnadales bacterium]
MARNDPVVGISITDTVVRSLALHPVSLRPLAAAETLISGSLAETLRESLRTLRVRPALVAAGLGLERATVRRMTLPQTSAQNVDRMVRFEAERYIPLPLEAVELSYQARPERAGDRLQVVVAAVRKDDATQFSQALADATSAKCILDTAGTALLAAWQEAHGTSGEPALLVDLSGHSASLVVCESGNLVLARAVPTGVEALRGAIAEDLRISSGEAEQVRRTQGVQGLKAGPPDLTAAEEVTDRELTASWLTRLAQEIRRTLESYRGQRSGIQRCAIALTGEGADTPGLVAALEEAVGQSLSVFDPCAGLELGGPVPGHHFTIAYGLALRAAGHSPVAIDLSPQEARASRRRRRERMGWAMAAILLVITISAGYLYADRRLREIEQEARTVQQRLNVLRAEVGDIEVALASAAAIDEIDARLKDLQKREARPLDVLYDVSSSLPSGIWLTDFLYDQDRGLSLHGKALDSVAVTEAVRALSWRTYLQNVKLSSINIVTEGDQKQQVYEFDITAEFPTKETEE